MSEKLAKIIKRWLLLTFGKLWALHVSRTFGENRERWGWVGAIRQWMKGRVSDIPGSLETKVRQALRNLIF